ncbi:MAG: winged-helix domain-containing protein [Treponema sp.]|nr:winged-helix domain-containing protein [Treponema sp.]
MALIPKKTRERLVLISSVLEKFPEKKITSVEISKILKCKDSLVRYDLTFIDYKKGVSNGYDVKELNESIKKVFTNQEFLNSELKKCCVVGLSKFGEALLDEKIFSDSGFKIEAGFDSSANRVDLFRSAFELYPATKIEQICIQKKIEYAFLCCNDSESEKMVQRLIKGGIKGIVNYTNSVFFVPDEIKIVHVSPVFALKNLELS